MLFFAEILTEMYWKSPRNSIYLPEVAEFSKMSENVFFKISIWKGESGRQIRDRDPRFAIVSFPAEYDPGR